MTQRSQVRDPRSRLAMGCSTLARAGQQLSTATSPEQARVALEQVATQLESDRNLSGLMPVEEIVGQLQAALAKRETGELPAVCRQFATQLARRASSLAAEVQQQGKAAPAIQPTAAPTPRAEPVSRPPEPKVPVTPEPQPQPALVEEAQVAEPPKPEPAAEPAPVAASAVPPTAEPQPAPDSRLARITVAQSQDERDAVVAALDAGKRFARVRGVLVIDTKTNCMWAAQLMPGMKHAAASAAARALETGSYRDWRLPTATELLALMEANGLVALRGLGVLPAMKAPLLWSGDVRSRFLGLFKNAPVLNSGTGAAEHASLSNVSVQTLAVRTAG